MENDTQKSSEQSGRLMSALLISFCVNLVLVISSLFIVYELPFSTGTKKVILIAGIVLIYIIAVWLHIAIIKKMRICDKKQRVIYCIVSLLGMCPYIWIYTFSFIDLLFRIIFR